MEFNLYLVQDYYKKREAIASLFYIRLLTLNVLQKWTSFDAEMQQRTLGNCKILLRIIVKTVSSDDVFIYLVTYFFLVVINLTNGKR